MAANLMDPAGSGDEYQAPRLRAVCVNAVLGFQGATEAIKIASQVDKNVVNIVGDKTTTYGRLFLHHRLLTRDSPHQGQYLEMLRHEAPTCD